MGRWQCGQSGGDGLGAFEGSGAPSCTVMPENNRTPDARTPHFSWMVTAWFTS